MQIIKKTKEVIASIDGNGELVIIQRNDIDDDDMIVIDASHIEAFMLGLQQVIKDAKNG